METQHQTITLGKWSGTMKGHVEVLAEGTLVDLSDIFEKSAQGKDPTKS